VQRDVVDDARHLGESQRRVGRAGLAPSVRSSDGKARLGHITRQGSPALCWALVEAAQKITAGSGPCARGSSGSLNAAGARSRK
jgi:transposase